MGQKKFEYVILKIEEGICTISLNRPKRLNALNYPLLMEIIDILEKNFKNNVVLTHKVLNAAKQCKNLERFLFASSYLVYSPDL